MATPNIVPRAAGGGSLGTSAKGWGGLYATDITMDINSEGIWEDVEYTEKQLNAKHMRGMLGF